MAEQMEGKRLALLRVVETDVHHQRLVGCHGHVCRQVHRHILLELLGLEGNVGGMVSLDGADGQADAGL
ncbi:hypothetical protein D3C76_1832750 [compost metagenome]